MKKIYTIEILLLLAIVLFSCGNEKMSSGNFIEESINLNSANSAKDFFRTDNVAMIYPLEYYKRQIEIYQGDFYGFENISMKITDMMNISSITKIDNVVPDLLTFFVCWINQKGSVYYLYAFDENEEPRSRAFGVSSFQTIDEAYFCGQSGWLISEKQTLMEKVHGRIIENEVVSIGDFNNDGLNEIALYSQYQNIGNAFLVHGFNLSENEMQELCVVPVFINLQKIFPSVESIENGFKVLEVLDNDSSQLAWNNYIWDEKNGEKQFYRAIRF